MHLICGLGNPGRKYIKTRHNIGFMAIDRFCSDSGGGAFSNKFKGEYLIVKKNGMEFIALKPQTYMNLSGECVRDIVNYFKIERDKMIILCDDVNLEFGKLRIRAAGSDGGHNGLKSIFHNLGANNIARLRIGVGADLSGGDLADYVLQDFTRQQQSSLDSLLEHCAMAVKTFIINGLDFAMNNFNNKIII